MITFRKTLMATTMLAGLAIVAFDAAQAGPNGGPSIGGSISGFSSMRVDFNRIGGPNRALFRNDMRVVPIDVTNTDKGAAKKDAAKKDAAKKDAAKKGINTARVSNPKSTSGGRGKEDIKAVTVRIPPHLEEIFHLTNGNLDDLTQLMQLADWIKNGPLRVPGPFATPNGDEPFAIPEEFGGGHGPGGGNKNDRNFLDGWGGYSNAPGGPDTSKTGWAGIWVHVHTEQGNGYRISTYRDSETGRTGTVESYWRGDMRQRTATVRGRDDAGNPTTDEISHENNPDSEGGHETRVEKHTQVEDGMLVTDYTMTVKDKDGNIVESNTSSSQEPYNGNDPDKQPAEEGTGRPSGRTGWCSPTGGCVTGSVVRGPRIIPASDYSTPQTNSQLPSWATDPCPDCTSRGGGGGGRYLGWTHEEGDGDEGGPIGGGAS